MSANEKHQDIFYDLFSYNCLRLLFFYLIYFQSGKKYHFSPHSGKKIMIFSFNSGKIGYFFHNILEKSKRISLWTLYRELLSFMIVGLKENVSYIIKSVPEWNTDGKWIKKQILDSLKTSKNCGFRIRAIVSDNHSANVLAYKLLLKEFGDLDDNLFIERDYQKICLFHDAVHLIKSVRNKFIELLTLHISSFWIRRFWRSSFI